MQHSGRRFRINIKAVIATAALLLTSSWRFSAISGTSTVASEASAGTEPTTTTTSGVTWLTSLKSARSLSASNGKLILVDFSATWCGPCQAMITETFPDPAVEPLLKKLICVRIDVDQDPATANQFNVDGIPRILLLGANPSDPPKMDSTGYEDANTFANQLRTALGMPQIPYSESPAPAIAPDEYTVMQALADNQYAELKTKSAATALTGLKQLVAELGEPPDSQILPIQATLLARAGNDTYTALLAGMKSHYLSDRVGAYSMFEHLYGAKAKGFSFDPWGRTKVREMELGAVGVAGKSKS